jgi:hypothetical protein
VSGRTKFSIAIAAVALLAVLAAAASRVDLSPDPEPEPRPEASGQARPEPARRREPARRPEPARRAEGPAPPSNPDEVRGNEERSLTRPANLRRALAILDARRRRVEGVFDGLRIAPGRIDTTVETPTRRMHLQVRTDFRIGFETDSEFPNRPDFRRHGLTARDVDLQAPRRILARIDRVRDGSAARDLDYVIIRRDIIDFRVNIAAYLRSGPRPRMFSDEADEPFRAIG